MSHPADPRQPFDEGPAFGAETAAQHVPLAGQDGSSLLGILDEIRVVVANAKPVPMSASVRVNRAELLELVDAAAKVVPPSIAAAEHIVAESRDTIARAEAESDRILAEATRRRDEILAEAESEATRIVDTARAQGEELIADERVVHLAEHRSRELVAEARAEAARLADNANVYADDRLAGFEEELERLRAQVAAGRDAITRRRADVADDLDAAYAAAEEARRRTADDPADRPVTLRGGRQDDLLGEGASARPVHPADEQRDEREEVR